MRKVQSIFLVFLCLVLSGAKKNETLSPPSFALVELFTSEGCSSCPAADEVLKEMTTLLRKENKNVISLAYHVTYWNRQGWVDPYSQEIFTEHQKKYVKANKTSMVFTPQAVVNGSFEFIGSNPFGFRTSVESALAVQPGYFIEARSCFKDGKVVLSYEVNKVPRNSALKVALVEPEIDHKVLRGENKDRLLHHFNVVRWLESYEIRKQDTVQINYDAVSESMELVLFLQHEKSQRVWAAAKVEFGSNP